MYSGKRNPSEKFIQAINIKLNLHNDLKIKSWKNSIT